MMNDDDLCRSHTGQTLLQQETTWVTFALWSRPSFLRRVMGEAARYISGHNVVIKVSFLFWKGLVTNTKNHLFWTAHPKKSEEPLTAGVGWAETKIKPTFRGTVFGQLHRFGRFLLHPILGFVLWSMCRKQTGNAGGPKQTRCVFKRQKNIFPDYQISGLGMIFVSPKNMGVLNEITQKWSNRPR